MANLKRDRRGRIYYDLPGDMAKKPIPVRFTIEVDGILRRMSDRSAYIREAVETKLKTDGLLE